MGFRHHRDGILEKIIASVGMKAGRRRGVWIVVRGLGGAHIRPDFKYRGYSLSRCFLCCFLTRRQENLGREIWERAHLGL